MHLKIWFFISTTLWHSIVPWAWKWSCIEIYIILGWICQCNDAVYEFGINNALEHFSITKKAKIRKYTAEILEFFLDFGGLPIH